MQIGRHIGQGGVDLGMHGRQGARAGIFNMFASRRQGIGPDPPRRTLHRVDGVAPGFRSGIQHRAPDFRLLPEQPKHFFHKGKVAPGVGFQIAKIDRAGKATHCHAKGLPTRLPCGKNRLCSAALPPGRFGHGVQGRIAQLVEQLTLNQRVVGSNPTAPTSLRAWRGFRNIPALDWPYGHAI